MKLNEYRSAYEDLSGIASQINRSIVMACVAAIWIIKPEIIKENHGWPILLSLSLIGFCTSLFIDLLQYFIQSLTIYTKYKTCDKGKDDDEVDLMIPVGLFWTLWILKIAVSLIAFGLFAIVFCIYCF